MKTIFDQHIGIFKNAIDPNWCDSMVEFFEKYNDVSEHRTNYFSKDALDADDNSIDLKKLIKKYPKESNYIIKLNSYFDKILNDFVYKSYLKRYPGFPYSYNITGYKIQKTLPGKGFHIWHAEQDRFINPGAINRFMAYTVYLNDIKEGGETEFLEQHKRVSPEKGTIVLFPSGQTHIHRGNPPMAKTKYIATGWLELKPFQEIINK